MRYGTLPVEICNLKINVEEMMYYQYLPIKMPGPSTSARIEDRLLIFKDLIITAASDFVKLIPDVDKNQYYIYLTVKNKFESEGCSSNRKGWHSDGFMSNDINYIWSNANPTVFNNSDFNLSQDDVLSMKEMEEQALPENDLTYPNNTLLRLDQYVIHKVNENPFSGLRCFVKISFSKDKYDLKGNSHNYLFNYNWDMRDRSEQRNIPQLIKNQNG